MVPECTVRGHDAFPNERPKEKKSKGRDTPGVKVSTEDGL